MTSPDKEFDAQIQVLLRDIEDLDLRIELLVWRCHGLQEGHHPRADEGVRCADPGPRYPERDQGQLLADRFRALRSLGLPHLQAQVEDGQGDRREEDGGSAFAEVERDGAVQLPAAAATGVRHLQELRGSLPRCVHGRKRGGYAWQGHFLRAQGRCSWWRWRQEEVRQMQLVTPE